MLYDIKYEALYGKAYILSCIGRYEEVLELYNLAAELDPDFEKL